MDDEIKTQANDELAQALASVSDNSVADLASPTVAATATSDDDFSDFAQTDDRPQVQPSQPERPQYKPEVQEPARADRIDRYPAQSAQPTARADVAQPTVASAPVNLENIKERALSELRPLMESIDIPVQEKYETYLMMLRASDDQSLIEPTFKAARMIEDDKTRAKALLDIVHEINYLSTKA